MHVLARFAPKATGCGVWTDGTMLTALETYPAACRGSAALQSIRHSFPALGNDDLDDALTCALVAHLYAATPNMLVAPAADVPVSEGWIWLPVDAVGAVGQTADSSSAQDASGAKEA